MTDKSTIIYTISRTVRRSTGAASLLMVILAWAVSPDGPTTAAKGASQAVPDTSRPHVVFVVGEQEYGTAETLPRFAEEVLAPEGFRYTFIHADPEGGNRFPGLEQALAEADLLFLSVRRRTPPDAQLQAIRDYVDSGRPLVAIRTASHAFALRSGDPPDGHAVWPEFDEQVLGASYEGHYGNDRGTEAAMTLRAESHPIMRGIDRPSFRSGGTLYRSRDLRPTTEVLLNGSATDGGEQVTEPVVWTNTHNGGRVFYSSLGHPEDFGQEPFERMLLNAVWWTLGREVPRDMSIAGNPQVADYIRTRPGRGATGDASAPTPPREALEAFDIREDLRIQLVASEPTIHQPLDIYFDHRGRLWIVQYIQYPYPEGARITEYDVHMRAEFDTIPAPPPDGPDGADRITVLSDSNGDGTYDTAQEVIAGLNITSSLTLGRGGLWVLSPPHLLFYPDESGDGLPDGAPEVKLEGFGLDDTHAIANSLTWGPDGWLYGAQGSTVHSTVSSAVSQDVHFKGQAIWRYHPETEVFEVYAEGGGNTWSVEFDSKGRLFSGTNHGVRGLHYKQGAYYEKSWGKHGPLTNPYAFGYFSHMRHTGNSDRFTHNMLIYEGGRLPEYYAGKFIGVNPLQNRIQSARLEPVGSTFETVETDRLIETSDQWFRPVDIAAGPDGALYVADWYDTRLTHVDPSDNWHRASGRIYRLTGGEAAPTGPFDLSERSTDELIDLLSRENKWYRRTALRLIGDRKDEAVVPRLKEMVAEESGEHALRALWALHLSGGFDEAFMPVGLEHSSPHVRKWTVRLIGDRRSVPASVADRLIEAARMESSVLVRSQMAASARRMPGEVAIPMIRELLARAEDIDDPHIPLQLWWALETHAASERGAITGLFEDEDFWDRPIVEQTITERLMRRYVMAGGRENLETAARLLELAPEESHTDVLITGLQEGLRGREMDDLPPALDRALSAYQQRVEQSDLALGVRQGSGAALEKVLNVVRDPSADRALRIEYIELLGEVDRSEAVPALLDVLGGSSSGAVRRVTLKALMQYDRPEIAERVIGLYPRELRADPDVRAAAIDLLASREAWALQLLEMVDDLRRIDPDDIPLQIVQRLALYEEPEISRLIEQYWPRARPGTSEEIQRRMEEVREILASGTGSAEAGREVFERTCESCHAMGGRGGTVGPELTGYDRDNLDYMLRHTVDPNAYVREGYVNYVVETADGRTLTGVIADRSGGGVVLQAVGGERTSLAAAQIDTMRAMEQSIMPEGLLEPLSDQEIRDLFEFLRTD